MTQSNRQIGDATAETVFRFLASLSTRMNRTLADDFLSGRISTFANFRFLTAQTGIDTVRLYRSIDYLQDKGFIRYEKMFEHGADFWLRARVEESVATVS